MSTMSDKPAALTAIADLPRPSFAEQKNAVLGARVADTVAIADRWTLVADLLDELITDYDAHVAEGAARASTARQLQDVMDAFDVLGAEARTNAEVLDDLATEITIAQARMATIWNEYECDRAQAQAASLGLVERRYAGRAAREVWYPLDGSIESAATSLRPVQAEGSARDVASFDGAGYENVVRLTTN